jgi:hypothetical protein
VSEHLYRVCVRRADGTIHREGIVRLVVAAGDLMTWQLVCPWAEKWIETAHPEAVATEGRSTTGSTNIIRLSSGRYPRLTIPLAALVICLLAVVFALVGCTLSASGPLGGWSIEDGHVSCVPGIGEATCRDHVARPAEPERP